MSEPNRQSARDVYLHEIATNPRFREAPKSGAAYVILGARPSTPKGMSDDGENRQEERR